MKGGPDGGDGGRGGHIILRGNRNRWTLLHLRYHKHVIAGNGAPGGKGCKTGADGRDVYLDVPLGTVAKDENTGDVEFEITEHGETRVLVSGGRGGKGNERFKSANKQAPRHAQEGEAGQEQWKILELKVVADVGLVGFPNAGKSTLLSVLSAAKPEIADYPFTTLKANLGVVPYGEFDSFVMADIPGLIEGAHEGKGLGTRFLRHIERNALLLFVIPVDSDNIGKAYRTLLGELESHSPELLHKRRALAVSKADLLDEELREELVQELPGDLPHCFISAVQESGLSELKELLWKMLHADTNEKD